MATVMGWVTDRRIRIPSAFNPETRSVAAVAADGPIYRIVYEIEVQIPGGQVGGPDEEERRWIPVYKMDWDSIAAAQGHGRWTNAMGEEQPGPVQVQIELDTEGP